MGGRPLQTTVISETSTSPGVRIFSQLLRHGKSGPAASRLGVFATWQVDQPWFSLPLDHCLVSPDVAIRRLKSDPTSGAIIVPCWWVAVPPVEGFPRGSRGPEHAVHWSETDPPSGRVVSQVRTSG